MTLALLLPQFTYVIYLQKRSVSKTTRHVLPSSTSDKFYIIASRLKKIKNPAFLRTGAKL